MSTLILATYATTEGTVSVFTPSSHIRCECGSGAGYLEGVSANMTHTLADLTWTCSICGVENVECIRREQVREAFGAFGVLV